MSDRSSKAMNNWMDKAEGKKVGSSNAGIAKERKAQGYDKRGTSDGYMPKKTKLSASDKKFNKNIYHE